MNILIDMPVFEPVLSALKEVPNVNIKIVEEPEEKERVLSGDIIQDCHVLFCTIPPKNHELMTQLQLIQISSTGYNQVIGKGFDKKDIKVCNARGVFDIPIAEWNIAMMINLSRNMRKLMHHQDAKIWDRSAEFQLEIRGSTVGIWGYGGIGRETTRLAKALGMKVHVLVRNQINHRDNIYCVPKTGDPEGVLPDRVFAIKEKEAFLKDLDFLILAIPQTPENEGIIGEKELQSMSQKTFILNPARGPLIQEQPFIDALQKNRIAGAALDTHYYYPMPGEHPFWTLPNVIMTPHISGSSKSNKFLERVWEIFMENVKKLAKGEQLINELTPLQLRGKL